MKTMGHSSLRKKVPEAVRPVIQPFEEKQRRDGITLIGSRSNTQRKTTLCNNEHSLKSNTVSSPDDLPNSRMDLRSMPIPKLAFEDNFCSPDPPPCKSGDPLNETFTVNEHKSGVLKRSHDTHSARRTPKNHQKLLKVLGMDYLIVILMLSVPFSPELQSENVETHLTSAAFIRNKLYVVTNTLDM